jgi:hypothetical protein
MNKCYWNSEEGKDLSSACWDGTRKASQQHWNLSWLLKDEEKFKQFTRYKNWWQRTVGLWKGKNGSIKYLTIFRS